MTTPQVSSVDLQRHDGARAGFQLQEDASVRQTPLASSTGMARLGHIDALRGMAAVQVLLGHVMFAFFPSILFASPFEGSFPLGVIAATPLFFPFDGISAVCIFFVLSGYVLTSLFTRSRANSLALALSRWIRLGAPALAGCALSAFLYAFFSEYPEKAGALANSQWLAQSWRPSPDLGLLKDALVDGLLLGFRGDSVAQWLGVPGSNLLETVNSYMAPLWTLSLEFYGSLLVLILVRARSWPLVALTALLVSRSYLFCFVAGHAAARLGLADKRPSIPWPLAAALAGLGVMVCMASHFWSPGLILDVCALKLWTVAPCPAVNPAYVLRIYGATLFTLAVMQCSPARAFLAHRRLRALGPLSFPLYLTHWPIVFGLGSFVLVALAPSIGSHAARCVALLASVALTLAAAAAFEPLDRLALRGSRLLRERWSGLAAGAERP